MNRKQLQNKIIKDQHGRLHEVLLFELLTKANETKFTFKDSLTRTKIRYSKNFRRIRYVRTKPEASKQRGFSHRTPLKEVVKSHANFPGGVRTTIAIASSVVFKIEYVCQRSRGCGVFSPQMAGVLIDHDTILIIYSISQSGLAIPCLGRS